CYMPPFIASRLATDLPPITAPIDRPTFASMLIARLPNCRLSIRLLVSSAKDDIVVREPQNPIATNRLYLVSQFHITDKIENTPSIKLPMTLTMRMLTGSVPRMTGDSAILYLKKAPATAPAARNTNSIPFICPPFSQLVGIISTFRKGRFWLAPRLMP